MKQTDYPRGSAAGCLETVIRLMKKVNEIDVRGTLVRILKIDGHDFVCITDIAHLKSDDPAATISNWCVTG